MNLALALRTKGDLSGALLHLRRVATGEPDDANVHFELGQTLRQAGDLSAAKVAFEKSVELNPELQEAYYALGLALKQQSAGLKHAGSPASTEPLNRARASAATGDLNTARDHLLAI